jgi:hypothetical protein
MKRYLLALAMLCVAAMPAMAQLQNGGFNGLPPWTFGLAAPCQENSAVITSWVKPYSLQVDVTTAEASVPWCVQLSQPNIPVVAGQPVTITFQGKSNVADQVQYGIQQNGGAWAWYGFGTANLSTAATTQSMTFTPSVTDPDAVIRFNLGGLVGVVDLANVSVTYGGVPTNTLTVSINGGGRVTSSPAGIGCATTCSAAFDVGVNVTLTATPGSGETFTGWSAPCSGTGTCLVVMSAAKNVTATFSNVTSTRNVMLQPFASNSIWNMPIGSGAVYRAAGITAPPNSVYNDDEIFIFTPTAPLQEVYYDGAGWQSGVNRCDFSTWPLTNAGFSVPVPTNYLLNSSAGTPNNSGAVLEADNQTFKQFNPIMRCTAGGPMTYTDEFGVSGSLFPDANLYTDGTHGSHGSGLSAIGGSIRLGDIVPGSSPIVNGVADVMRHAIHLELFGLFNSFGYGPFWPATNADGGNEGLLVALLPSLNYNGLQTAPARSIAWTLINYGAYLVENPNWNATGIGMEKSTFTLNGVVTSAADQFQSNWGYPVFQFETNSPWVQDIEKIVANLQVITNNSPTNIGGGGTPRQPLLPPVTAP